MAEGSVAAAAPARQHLCSRAIEMKFKPRFGGTKSGGGPPQSKTLARWPMIPELREASWSRQPSGALGAARGKRETVGKVDCGWRGASTCGGYGAEAHSQR